MKIAALQMTSADQLAANLMQAQELLKQAARDGAGLAVLPENFAFMGLGEQDKYRVAESPGAGPIQDFLAQQSRQLQMWIIAGTIPLKVEAETRVAPACVVYDASGAPVARYDKIHLFDVDVPGRKESYRESASMVPGSRPVSVATPAGKVGLSVCYDVRFPELFRKLSAEGAQLFTVPAAFTAATGPAHWEVLLRARAIENLCYVIAPGQHGILKNGRATYGNSMIIGPWGKILQRLDAGPGVITADIDLATLTQLRQDFPALNHRVFV
jgi:deaminated glutathione amidase